MRVLSVEELATKLKCSSFDLPEHKRSVDEPQKLHWLVRNFGTRNRTHPDYHIVKASLILAAKAAHVIKQSELRKLGLEMYLRDRQPVRL